MKRGWPVSLALSACVAVALAVSSGTRAPARAADEQAPRERAAGAEPRSTPPPEWRDWSDQQRKDWRERKEKQASPDFFPEGWKDWDGQRRGRWWHSWEEGREEEGIFAVIIPSGWKGWGKAHRERWWREQVWRHRFATLLEQESEGLLPWVFPERLPDDWDRRNSAQREKWLRTESHAHSEDGVLYPRTWPDWPEDVKRAWWDDIADQCGFQPGRIFPRGWDGWEDEQHEEWWKRMDRSGVGYLASALPDEWNRWNSDQQERWLRGVLAAKENVARAANARLRAALGSVESAVRRGVPPGEAEEMGLAGLMHGLRAEEFRAFGRFLWERAGRGVHGDDLRREIQAEAERRSKDEGRSAEEPAADKPKPGASKPADKR